MRQSILITDVQKGDTILEGTQKTEVTKIDRERCKNHTHINDKDCYDNAAEVLVQYA